jgi:hypothetical protein
MILLTLRARAQHLTRTFKGHFLLASKVLISLWLVYHLLAVFVLPGGGSFVIRRLQSYLLPYANTVGVNTTWNFFSPDPANTMYFIYHINFENDEGEELKPREEGFFPPEKDKIVTNGSRRRLLYAMRFLMLDSRRLQTLMAPWLCREYPEASRVSIQMILEKIPSLDRALLAGADREQIDSQKVSYSCHGPQDEISL